MASTYLRRIAEELNYDDLPVEWQVDDVAAFSQSKTLHEFQQRAVKTAACLLRFYYESGVNTQRRNGEMEKAYQMKNCNTYGFAIRQWVKNQENPIFKILSPSLEARDEKIYFRQFCNRMGFWMATGSGKTLVMIKIIEHLQRLMARGLIPSRPILVLAPGETMLKQIKRSIDEFNEAKKASLYWTPLRQFGRNDSLELANSQSVYYYRADNISDEQKEKLLDYRNYENRGEWYVLLDEAHKGGKTDSKRQAYFSLLARNGFLFNFSATFTENEDVATTAFKYNLQDFIKNGYGKHLLLAKDGFESFRGGSADPDENARRRILLKSLLTLACVKKCARDIRVKSKISAAYHEPMMMTLVNSVGTDATKNDLWAFFAVLRGIARGDIEQKLFRDAKNELRNEWRQNSILQFEGNENFARGGELLQGMSVAAMRELIFHSPKRSELDALDPENSKELAFQLRGADAPFALLRIGNTGKWRNEFLQRAGIDISRHTLSGAFFDNLDKGRISILLGSRAFIEGWDSNRPNVINFVNIGVGLDAQKFTLQALGRGVRIAPLPGKRRRRKYLAEEDAKPLAGVEKDAEKAVETVFAYATNRRAVEAVVNSLTADEGDKKDAWELLSGFEQQNAPLFEGARMLLLRPEYETSALPLANTVPFGANKASKKRLNGYLDKMSDSALAVGRLAQPAEIDAIREAAARIDERNKAYANTGFMLERLRDYLQRRDWGVGGMRELLPEKDIVHFRHISTNYGGGEFDVLQDKIKRVAASANGEARRQELDRQLEAREINPREYARRINEIGEESDKHYDVNIRHLDSHYFTPLLTADGGTEVRVRHIIKTESEAEFLCDLEDWMKENNGETGWSSWMFCKLDETLDKIHIPYFDGQENHARNFYPDFIFWMQRKNEYRIVFADPHGTAHASYEHKIDGYMRLFENSKGEPKRFSFANGRGKKNIQVILRFFNENPGGVGEQYRRFYISRASAVFE